MMKVGVYDIFVYFGFWIVLMLFLVIIGWDIGILDYSGFLERGVVVGE